MHRTAWLIVVPGLVFSPAAAAQPSAWPCDPKCFDAGVQWDSRTHYLFKGGEYISYSDGKPETGYPRSIGADWKGLAEFSSGIDAAVSWGNGRIYFFKGDRYVRYEVSPSGYGEYYAPEPLSGNWPFPATWLSGISAGVNWGNGKIYFFRGTDYLTYDIATNEAGRPRPISVGWKAFPKSWWAGIDAAVDWGIGSVYFFKGKQYLRYLIAPDGTAKNFGPKSISEGEVFTSEMSGSRTTQAAPVAATPGAALDECDRLAASEMDPTRPASARSVADERIDATVAVPACLAAVKSAPKDARIVFQLGCALRAAKRDENARKAYELAVALGHVAAAVDLAIMLEQGAGGPRDVMQARNLYEQAAAAGHSRATDHLQRMKDNIPQR